MNQFQCEFFRQIDLHFTEQKGIENNKKIACRQLHVSINSFNLTLRIATVKKVFKCSIH